MNDSSLKNKIAGLLAKAERTDNEHERDAFTAKAEALMIKYGIEQAELEAAGEVKPEDIVEERIVHTGIYATILPEFDAVVCEALGALRVLRSRSRDGKSHSSYIIGHKSDVEAAVILCNSLRLQAVVAMRAWWKTSLEREMLGSMEAYKARRQFIRSFGFGAGQRIISERRIEEEQATPGAALVLVSKADRVNEFVDEMDVKPTTRSVDPGYGASAGRAAGRNANIGTTALGGSRGALER